MDRLAAHIARTHPGLRGFTRPNLFRMRQFYEAYANAGEKVSALLRQIPWTHHLMILGQAKRPEERRAKAMRCRSASASSSSRALAGPSRWAEFVRVMVRGLKRVDHLFLLAFQGAFNENLATPWIACPGAVSGPQAAPQ